LKIALVSDIHADARALKRVFDDLPSVDRVLCAGDAISEFQFCPDTVDLLRLADAQCIQGNHEHVLFGGQNPGYLAKCRSEYAPELLDRLAQAPTTFEIESGGAKLLMVHATPWSPFAGYVNPGSPFLRRISALPFNFVVLGHTHRPMIETAGAVTVINPGSCSQPRDGTREGSYAILDLATGAAEIRKVRLG
jgi:putative phosphoesterase